MLRKFDEITPDMYEQLNKEIEQVFDEGCHGQCASCKSGCSEPRYPRYAKVLYAVTGGKGGTGKSVICALLAVALARRGYRVGILDADLPGSTQPQLFGASGPIRKAQRGEKSVLEPQTIPCGIGILSYNLIEPDLSQPVLMPGVDQFNVVSYFYTDGAWDGYDIILIDMPSGAGDVPLNLYSSLPVNGVVIVSEPSELAVVATQRCINLCNMLMSPPVAFVENKSITAECVSDALYSGLPEGCVCAALSLSPEVSVASCDGTIDRLEVPELEIVAERLLLPLKR